MSQIFPDTISSWHRLKHSSIMYVESHQGFQNTFVNMGTLSTVFMVLPYILKHVLQMPSIMYGQTKPLKQINISPTYQHLRRIVPLHSSTLLRYNTLR